MADAPYESKDDPTVALTSLDTVGNRSGDNTTRGEPRLSPDDTEKLNGQTRTLICLLLGSVLTCAICLIVGLQEKKSSWIGFSIIEIVTILVSFIAAYNVYQWGIVSNEINHVTGLNASLESEHEKLKIEKTKYLRQVNTLKGRIKVLNGDVLDLETQLEHFDRLKREMRESIDVLDRDIGTGNTDVDNAEHYLDELNELIVEMKQIFIENEKAYLYELYYTMEYRDNEKGLNKREYERLLQRLPEKSRKLLVNNQTFEDIAGDDNVIDLQEFQQFVANYLSQLEQQPLNLGKHIPKR